MKLIRHLIPFLTAFLVICLSLFNMSFRFIQVDTQVDGLFFFFKEFIYYVYRILPACIHECMHEGQKRAPDPRKLEAIHKTYLPCAHVQLWLLADASHIHSHLLFVLTRPMKLFPLSTDLPIVDFTYNQSCIIWEPSFLAFFFLSLMSMSYSFCGVYQDFILLHC